MRILIILIFLCTTLPASAQSSHSSGYKFAAEPRYDTLGAVQPAQAQGPMFNLNAKHEVLAPEAAKAPLNSSISRTALALSKYKLELIIDRSMSMRVRDCPGFSSRWSWCGSQAEELGRELSALASNGINITTFAYSFSVFENRSPTEIGAIFARSRLQFGTRLGEALADRLKRCFSEKQKNTVPQRTLIAVITDGVPHPAYEPQYVADVLVSASKAMQHPDELRVVFLQIGAQDKKGRRYLKYLDEGLTNYGARFDFVSTVTFEHLKNVGLAQALVDSIADYNHNQN